MQNGNQKKIAAFVGLLAIVIIVGIGVALTQKKSSDTDSTTATQSSQSQSASPDTTDTADTTATTTNASYKDGDYTATGSYSNPGGTSEVKVKLTVKDGVVTDSTVTPEAEDSESREYQERFVSGYKQYVVGKALDGISVSRVSGSSLTSQGFNEALENIKDQAKA